MTDRGTFFPPESPSLNHSLPRESNEDLIRSARGIATEFEQVGRERRTQEVLRELAHRLDAHEPRRDRAFAVTEEMAAWAQDPRCPRPLAILLAFWATVINEALRDG